MQTHPYRDQIRHDASADRRDLRRRNLRGQTDLERRLIEFSFIRMRCGAGRAYVAFVSRLTYRFGKRIQR